MKTLKLLRSALFWRILLLAVAVAATIYAGYRTAPRWYARQRHEFALVTGGHDVNDKRSDADYPVESAEQVDFRQSVRGRGSVESVVNTNIVNKVDSTSTLTYVIPEGSHVEVGDVVARIDSQTCYNYLIEMIIIQLRIDSALINAEAKLTNANISLDEYVYGSFEEAWIKIENTLYESSQTLKSKDDLFRFTQRMVGLGYANSIVLDSYRTTKEEAKDSLQKAMLDREILLKYTSETSIASIVSKIDLWTMYYDWISTYCQFRREQVRLAQEQYDLCTIVAPAAGEIVYANQLMNMRWRNQSTLIQEGAAVTSGQLLFRIPGSDEMMIQTLVNETDVSAIKPGMRAKIVFGVNPAYTFSGSVAKVNPYPEFVWRSTAKNYMVNVQVDDPDRIRELGIDLRTGISADVEIEVDLLKNATIVPAHCLVYWQNQTYCLRRENGRFVCLPVTTGPADDTRVVVLDGLRKGENVLAHADLYISEVVFPEMMSDPALALDDAAAPKDKPKTEKEDGRNKKDDSKNAPKKIPFFEKMRSERASLIDRYGSLVPWFKYSSMEMCLRLDTNRDKTIDREEFKTAAPQFLEFYEQWDRNRDGVMTLAEFVYNYHTARSGWAEKQAQSDKPAEK